MVDGQLLLGDFAQVVSDAQQMYLQAMEGLELATYALRQGPHCLVLDISAEISLCCS